MEVFSYVHEVSPRLASPPLAHLPSLIYPCLSVSEVFRSPKIPGSMGKVWKEELRLWIVLSYIDQ